MRTMTNHHDIDLLEARRSLYALLAQCYLHPPDWATLATLRSIPDIADAVPATSDALERLQVEYEYVFGQNAYPYESLYIDHDLMLNTAAAHRVAQLCQDCGLTVDVPVGAPDHLGVELRLMAHLLSVESAAWREKNPALQTWSRAQQYRCLVHHLARWAPVFLRVVERVADHPLYRTLAQVTLELVLNDLEQSVSLPPWIPLDHRRDGATALPEKIDAKTQRRAISQSILSATGEAGAAPDERAGSTSFVWSHDDEERDLNQIVRCLIVPDIAGMFLSRRDISGLGRRLGIRAPMRERAQMMRDLFDAAARFDLLPALLDHLDELFATEFWRLAVLTERYPAWTTHAQQWLSRLDRSREMVQELRTQFLAYHAREAG
jgi:TorA maturation chaperone TorD